MASVYVTLCMSVCVSVCLCVHTLKGKMLELSTAEGQGHMHIKRAAGMGMHVDTTAQFFWLYCRILMSCMC